MDPRPLCDGLTMGQTTTVSTYEWWELGVHATSLRTRDDQAQIRVLDAAYWMKGCSSLGLLRYAVVLGIGDPPYRGEGLCLMDIKEAAQAAAPRYPRVRMPRDNAERVVEGARHLAPDLGQRMLATRFLDRAVFFCGSCCDKICKSKLNVSHATKQ